MVEVNEDSEGEEWMMLSLNLRHRAEKHVIVM